MPAPQTFAPVPDTLYSKAAAEKDLAKSVDATSFSGLSTPLGGANSTVTDLTAMGEGRQTVLELKMDRMADSVSGQTVIDPKGYLTDLSSMRVTSDADVSDIKKVRIAASARAACCARFAAAAGTLYPLVSAQHWHGL